jgi:hypothetical protein
MNREEALQIVCRSLFNREMKEVEWCREHELDTKDLIDEFYEVWEYIKENLK